METPMEHLKDSHGDSSQNMNVGFTENKWCNMESVEFETWLVLQEAVAQVCKNKQVSKKREVSVGCVISFRH